MVKRATFRPLKLTFNSWIGCALMLLNMVAWTMVLWASSEPYVVAPIRDQEVVELLDYIQAGNHSGETWEVNLTALEAEQTITWYLQKYPQIPFAHPQITITPDYVSGEGDATIGGLRIHVGGKARVTLLNGLPQVEILELSLALPAPVRAGIEAEIQRQLMRAELLPVRFTSAVWEDGRVIVQGVIR